MTKDAVVALLVWASLIAAALGDSPLTIGGLSLGMSPGQLSGDARKVLEKQDRSDGVVVMHLASPDNPRSSDLSIWFQNQAAVKIEGHQLRHDDGILSQGASEDECLKALGEPDKIEELTEAGCLAPKKVWSYEKPAGALSVIFGRTVENAPWLVRSFSVRAAGLKW